MADRRRHRSVLLGHDGAEIGVGRASVIASGSEAIQTKALKSLVWMASSLRSLAMTTTTWGARVDMLGKNGVERITAAIQAFGKWFFELLLNAAIVAGLLLAAKQTNNMAIKTLAYAAWAIFFLYVGSFFLHFRLDLFDWVKDPRHRTFFELASGIILAVIIVAGLNFMFQTMIAAAVSAIELSK